MAQEQKKQQDNNWVDEVGKTNVYPVSEMEGASDNAKIQDESSFGQGNRGAEGYNDSGTSEIIQDSDITNTEGSNEK